MSELNQALLAAVPADGSSIGNQSLLERLKGQFPQLTEEAFWDARDALIEQGVLQKGRGRGGSVLRAQAAASSLADQALNKARERFEPAQVAEGSAEYVLEAAQAVRKAKPAKAQPATSIEDIKKTLWATADKLRANMDAAEYKHIVLGLIFVKYISDTFADPPRRADAHALPMPDDDYYLDDADPELLDCRTGRPRLLQGSQRVLGAGSGPLGSLRAQAKQADIGKRIDDALIADRDRKPQAQGHPRQTLRPRAAARRQARRAGRSGLHHRLRRPTPSKRPRPARPGLRILPRPVRQRRRQAGGQFYTPASIVKTLVAVLAPHHGQVYDPCCGSGGMFVQIGEIHRSPRRQDRRCLHLRPGSQPDHLAAGGDEPGHSRHRLQSGQGTRRHLRARPAPRPARRFHPRQPAVQHQRLVARQPGRRPALGLRHAAARQRQLRLAAAHAAPPQARRPRRHRAGQRLA